jgi:hypothetical protein
MNESTNDSVWQELSPQKSTFTVTSRGLGRHSLHLKSVDAVGNVFEGGDMWLWDVGLPPSVIQVRGPVDPSHSAKGVFSITCAATGVHTLRGTMCREVEYWVTVSSKADAACDESGVETHRGECDTQHTHTNPQIRGRGGVDHPRHQQHRTTQHTHTH